MQGMKMALLKAHVVTLGCMVVGAPLNLAQGSGFPAPDLSVKQVELSQIVGDGLRKLPESYQQVRYTFSKVERNQFSARRAPEDTAPGALYNIEMTMEGSQWNVGAGMSYKEISQLLRFYKVSHPSELKGKSFLGKKGDPTSALDYLLVTIKHGGNYRPPSADTLYARAAAALYQMKKPDFSDVDQETIFKAFFAAYEAGEAWQTKLQNAISSLSGGRVKLESASVEEFSIRFQGPAKYLALNGELMPDMKKRRQLLIFGPYATPFTLDPGRGVQ